MCVGRVHFIWPGMSNWMPLSPLRRMNEIIKNVSVPTFWVTNSGESGWILKMAVHTIPHYTFRVGTLRLLWVPICLISNYVIVWFCITCKTTFNIRYVSEFWHNVRVIFFRSDFYTNLTRLVLKNFINARFNKILYNLNLTCLYFQNLQRTS